MKITGTPMLQEPAIPGLGHYRLHHVGIVVPSLEQAVAGYAGRFEFGESTVPFSDQAQRVRVAFIRVSEDVWVEFIEPMSADSPVTQFLSKSKGGYHHIAFEVADIESAVQKLEVERAL